METNIDVTEWRREVDRVQKLLEIPEYPEFLISGSNYSDISGSVLVNTNNDLNFRLNQFSGYLNKNVCKNINFEMLNNLSSYIENELNLIKKFENFVSVQENLKDILKASNSKNIELNSKKSQYFQAEEKLNNLEILLEDIIDKIKSNTEKEETLNKNSQEPKIEIKIINQIKQLKVKNNNFNRLGRNKKI